MAKPILNIAVDDTKFKEFLALYAKYEKALANSPAAWAKVTQSVAGTKKGFEELVALQIAQIANEKLRAAAAEEAERRLRTSADTWRDMAKSSKTFAGNVVDATKSLLRWASLTSVVSGLLGAGGLFGIDRLAISASNNRRASQGIGSTIGERNAFNTNFGQTVDTDSFLSSINEALHDQSKRQALYGSGLTEGDLSSGDSAIVGAKALTSIKSLLDRTPNDSIAQVLEGRNIPLSLADAVRLKKLTPEQFAQEQAGNEKDKSSLGYSDDVADKWQQFTIQMDRAGKKIEATFVDALVPLAPELTKLSDSFGDLVTALLKSPEFKEWINDLAIGIKDFAKYVGTPEFKQDVLDFATGIEKLAKSVGTALKWLGIISDNDAPAPAAPTPGVTNGGGLGGPNIGPNMGIDPLHPFGRSSNDNSPLGGEGEKTLALIKRLEASGDSAVSPAGAIGAYQIMPATGAHYGYSRADLFDPAKNQSAAEAYIKDLAKQYHGNLMEELVGYNSKYAVQKSFVASGDDPRVLPSETQKYLARATILIQNNTGGNAVVSTSQLAR